MWETRKQTTSKATAPDVPDAEKAVQEGHPDGATFISEAKGFEGKKYVLRHPRTIGAKFVPKPERKKQASSNGQAATKQQVPAAARR